MGSKKFILLLPRFGKSIVMSSLDYFQMSKFGVADGQVAVSPQWRNLLSSIPDVLELGVSRRLDTLAECG
jgi:hypothetical protein